MRVLSASYLGVALASCFLLQLFVVQVVVGLFRLPFFFLHASLGVVGFLTGFCWSLEP